VTYTNERDQDCKDFEKLGGRGGKGRPRLRWIDDVEEDVRNMDIKRWKTKALDTVGPWHGSGG
jgi:hypothetical protein